MSLEDRFRAQHWNIVIHDFSFVFFGDSLCIFKMWGALRVFNISHWILWKSHHIYLQTSMSKNNYGYSTLGKLWATLIWHIVIQMFEKLENLKLKYQQKVKVLWWAENETIFRKCPFLRSTKITKHFSVYNLQVFRQKSNLQKSEKKLYT